MNQDTNIFAPSQLTAAATSTSSQLPAPATSHVSGKVKIKKRELAALTSQLAIMLRSGVDVTSSLKTLARQSRTPSQKQIVEAIHADVMSGKSFSSALKPFSNVFGPTYIATVAAGEASGRMSEVLGQLAHLQRSELRLHNTIRTLLTYPIMLTTVSSAVLMALVLFVLPQFAEIFDQFDTPLPGITQVLISISNELRGRIWLYCPLLVLAILGLVSSRMSEGGRRVWDKVMLHTFLLRDVTRSLLIGRVCRLLGLMIDNGVPLIDSLRLARTSVGNMLYRELFETLEQNVLNGRGLGDSLIESEFIPPAAAEMVLTAEKTGNLGNVTQMIGEHFQEEGESKLREIVTFLEPAITVGMGAVVAVVVMAVMLPMFDMAMFAQG